MLGQNKQGLIPSKDDNIIVESTGEKWQKLAIGCSDFSISSHAVICNAKGDVAGWGCMYYYSEGEPTNFANQAEEGPEKTEEMEQGEIKNKEE